LEIKAGLTDFRKKTSFYLFFEKPIILSKFLLNSKMRVSIGLKSFLSPFAKICARYLLSFDSRESDSLGERLKCLIIASKNISSNDYASLTSFLGSISFKLI